MEQASVPQKRSKVPPKLIVAAVVLVIALIFILQNTAKATVQFLWMDSNSALWLWLLLAGLLGAIFGAIVGWQLGAGRTRAKHHIRD